MLLCYYKQPNNIILVRQMKRKHNKASRFKCVTSLCASYVIHISIIFKHIYSSVFLAHVGAYKSSGTKRWQVSVLVLFLKVILLFLHTNTARMCQLPCFPSGQKSNWEINSLVLPFVRLGYTHTHTGAQVVCCSAHAQF